MPAKKITERKDLDKALDYMLAKDGPFVLEIEVVPQFMTEDPVEEP